MIIGMNEIPDGSESVVKVRHRNILTSETAPPFEPSVFEYTSLIKNFLKALVRSSKLKHVSLDDYMFVLYPFCEN